MGEQFLENIVEKGEGLLMLRVRRAPRSLTRPLGHRSCFTIHPARHFIDRHRTQEQLRVTMPLTWRRLDLSKLQARIPVIGANVLLARERPVS